MAFSVVGVGEDVHVGHLDYSFHGRRCLQTNKPVNGLISLWSFFVGGPGWRGTAHGARARACKRWPVVRCRNMLLGCCDATAGIRKP